MITRSAQIINTKENIIYLEKAASACLDFVTGKYDVISFTDVMRWSGIIREFRYLMEIM